MYFQPLNHYINLHAAIFENLKIFVNAVELEYFSIMYFVNNKYIQLIKKNILLFIFSA